MYANTFQLQITLERDRMTATSSRFAYNFSFRIAWHLFLDTKTRTGPHVTAFYFGTLVCPSSGSFTSIRSHKASSLGCAMPENVNESIESAIRRAKRALTPLDRIQALWECVGYGDVQISFRSRPRYQRVPLRMVCGRQLSLTRPSTRGRSPALSPR